MGESQIGYILYGSLRRAGMTQRAAAKALGISNQYLNDILAGRRRLTPELASAFAEKIEPTDKGKFRADLHRLGAEADGWDVDAIVSANQSPEGEEGAGECQ